MGFMRQVHTTLPVRLKCPLCGTVFPIRRKKGRLKERGHIKDLYCARCRTVTKHIEIREADGFDAVPNLSKRIESDK